MPMRKYLLTCNLIVLFFLPAFCQQFLSEEKQWHISKVSDRDRSEVMVAYKLRGDTVLNGLTYKRLYYTKDTSFQNWRPANVYLREESLKIFRFSIIDGKESLLYDFELEVGEFFPLQAKGACQLVVTKVDSLKLGPQVWRKRWTLKNKENPRVSYQWIEGVGATTDFLNHGQVACQGSDEFRLDHYTENRTIIYTRKGGARQGAHSPAKYLPADSFNIYPNPTHGLITIEPPLHKENFRYKLFNAAGQQVVESFEREATKFTLNIGGLKPGIYFLEIQSANGGKITKKIERL